MIRKRAPGGGRKPKGAVPMRSQVNVRMPDDLLAQLQAAARKRGRNISEELLARLRVSFAREREQKRDPATRALTFLIANVAEQVHLGMSPEWNKVPFLFRAFRLAVATVLDALEPSGEMRPPYDWSEMARQSDEPLEQWFIDQYRTPETTAQSAADVTLRLLFGHREVLETVESGDPFVSEIYAMSNAHRDLKLTPNTRGD
jgi:Arc-like DNA binding domain